VAVGRPDPAAGETGGAAGKAADIVAAFEAMPAIVWAFSGPDHVVVAANRAARTSVGDRQDILGRPVRSLMPGAAGQEFWELLDDVYRTGQPRTEQARRLLVYDDDHREGGEPGDGFFDITALPVCDVDGRVHGVLAHVSDVTPVVRARQAAEHGTAYREPPERPAAPDEHELAQSLQHSLLPTELPVAPMVRVAAQYVAGGSDQVGGDWFDAVLLDDGTIAAVVGDVVSRGVGAATAMGQVRSALTAYALQGLDVVELLDRLDAYCRHVPAAVGTTVCVALLEPATGELRYASAGHPPPLVVRADGTTEYLAPASGRPLGLNEEPRAACTARLGPGEVLVLYSDGAIARPEQSIEQGRSRLAVAVGTAVRGGADAEATCVQVLADLTEDQPAHDDIALLVLHRLAEPVPPLWVSVPARPGQLAVLRQRLHDWMDASGVSDNDAVSVQIAVGEAASNVVEHAYPDGEPGEIHLGVTVTPNGELRAEVTDVGRWQNPVPGNDRRGRGLPLMRACMDSMEVTRGGGTTVRLRRRLRRPIAAATGADSLPEPPRQAAPGADLEVLPGAERVLLRLRGELDLAATEVIGGRVRAATRGGTVAATVDLTRVTHLDSAAVRLLFELADDGARHRQPMIVWVAAGSAVEQVFRLTGLDQAVELYRRPTRR
jgi:anti-anti-sigma factor